MRNLVTVIGEVGQHAVVFGERGVGKTSLVNVISDVLGGAQMLIVRVGCAASDDFQSIWRRAFSSMTTTAQRQGAGFAPEAATYTSTLADKLPEALGAGDVEALLDSTARSIPVVVIIDEFDRICDRSVTQEIADLIKTLSDQGADATVILVGVADDVEELVAEHASIERALKQIRMPRMSGEELTEIVDRGLGSVAMSATDEATQRITTLSQGLPHYTHLLAQAAAVTAADESVDLVDIKHVQIAMTDAIATADQSLSQRYNVAIASPRKNNLYSAVLLAAALTEGDDLGYFAPASVRDPLQAITRRTYEIPQFVKHLHAFCENDRGAVLQKTGLQHRNRFRFKNPMLQPYVIMKAVAANEIDLGMLARFLAPTRAQ